MKNKRTIRQKPKDQFFVRPSEGRIRTKRAASVKYKTVGWGFRKIIDFLSETGASLPESTWTVVCDDPARKLTARDFIRLIHYGRVTASESEVVEVKLSEKHSIAVFVDLSHILKEKEEVLGEGLANA